MNTIKSSKISIFSQEESNSRIQRGMHSKEKPYVMISKEIFKDPDLSIEAKGALGYMLCLPDDWVSHPRQLAEKLNIGKDKMYRILNELIKKGYAHKEVVKVQGQFSRVDYFFFEEKQEIQKMITVSENPDTVFPDPGNQTLLNNNSTENRSIQKKELSPIPLSPEGSGSMPAKAVEVRKKTSPEDWPSEVLETGQSMIEAMKETKPDCTPPNTQKLLTSIDLMIRVDKREAVKILRVFKWALADEFWRDKFFKPDPAKYLREKFDQLESKMNTKPFSHSKVDRRLRDKDGNVTTDEFKYDLF